MIASDPDTSTFPLIVQGTLELDHVQALLSPPALFAPGAARFWTDPHIAGQMLAAHLDPSTDAASRQPATIDAEVAWLFARLGLRAGDRVLDLGCGPGLYSRRLAERGLAVTGIDASASSLAYARRAAGKHGLRIDYRQQDYVMLADDAAFVAALLIYYDFGVLPDEQRDCLLARIHQALQPGGLFAFDVLTPVAIARAQVGTRWSVEPGGFWRPGQHLVLEYGHVYSEDQVTLRQVAIVEEDGTTTIYRIWMRYYTAARITALLERHGFTVLDMRGDLAGRSLNPQSSSLGIVAQRRG